MTASWWSFLTAFWGGAAHGIHHCPGQSEGWMRQVHNCGSLCLANYPYYRLPIKDWLNEAIYCNIRGNTVTLGKLNSAALSAGSRFFKQLFCNNSVTNDFQSLLSAVLERCPHSHLPVPYVEFGDIDSISFRSIATHHQGNAGFRLYRDSSSDTELHEQCPLLVLHAG